METNGATLKPAGNSQTSPKENKQGQVCYADVFKLTDLPDIMDKKGWKVASALMRKWFDSPAYTISQEEKGGKTDSRKYQSHLVDITTIKMSWVLSFTRIKQEHDKIFGSKGFFSSTPAEYEKPAARNELIKKLFHAGKFTDKIESFGNLQDSVLNINEKDQFQIHQIGDWLFQTKAYGKAAIKETFLSDPDLDDLWGALADFLIKIAGQGTVTPKTKIVATGLQSVAIVEYYDVSVEKVGTYIRDTYDFNGNQYLGHWSKTSAPYARLYTAGASRGDCPDDFLEINNERFRAHRAKTGKGGDILIFSDILITPLQKPFKFRVTPGEIPAR
jgi:hypothetical protein